MAKPDKAKYPALRIIAAWYKLVGCLLGLLIAVAGLVTVFGDGDNRVGTVLIVIALVFMIVSIAVAEIIQVFLDTERNTRHTAEATQRLVELHLKKTEPEPMLQTAPKRAAPAKPMARKASPEQAASIKTLIRNLHSDGLDAEQIAEELSKEGMPTLDGAPVWTPEAVDLALK